MTPDDVVRRVTNAAFGRPLVTNSLRGLLVEAIVSAALEPEWHWCGMDWGSWDFERADGLRLEVKQSSYRQTWSAPSHGKVSPGFDIRERSGRWEGSTFIAEPGRAAHIYVFAFHGVKDDSADHRDPAQWVFHVVRTEHLPPAKRISLSAVQRLSPCVPFDGLSNEVSGVASPRA